MKKKKKVELKRRRPDCNLCKERFYQTHGSQKRCAPCRLFCTHYGTKLLAKFSQHFTVEQLPKTHTELQGLFDLLRQQSTFLQDNRHGFYQPVHICHAIPRISGGKFTPNNLFLGFGIINQKMGEKHLPYGDATIKTAKKSLGVMAVIMHFRGLLAIRKINFRAILDSLQSQQSVIKSLDEVGKKFDSSLNMPKQYRRALDDFEEVELYESFAGLARTHNHPLKNICITQYESYLTS